MICAWLSTVWFYYVWLSYYQLSYICIHKLTQVSWVTLQVYYVYDSFWCLSTIMLLMVIIVDNNDNATNHADDDNNDNNNHANNNVNTYVIYDMLINTLLWLLMCPARSQEDMLKKYGDFVGVQGCPLYIYISPCICIYIYIYIYIYVYIHPSSMYSCYLVY